MFIPKRRSSLSQEINDNDVVIEDALPSSGCYLCAGTRVPSTARRRSSSSFKIGSFIDSLLIDRTSGSKSEPIEFTLKLLVTDYSHHVSRGGQAPSTPRKLSLPLSVQYVEWKDSTPGFGPTQPSGPTSLSQAGAAATGSGSGSDGSTFYSSPLVGSVDISRHFMNLASPQKQSRSASLSAGPRAGPGTSPGSLFGSIGPDSESTTSTTAPASSGASAKFPGFSIPYRSTIQVSVDNTEGTTVAICLLNYDLSKLPANHKRLVRFKSNSHVVQVPFFKLNKKFYVGDSIRLVMLNKEEMIKSNWEVQTLSEVKFDPSHYTKCERCQVKTTYKRNFSV